jgi:type II secretory pathway component PulK
VHTTDFARLFHSSVIDTEVLARPTIVSESRKESALKYLGVWGSSRVNINTAPRQVLEAAFTFGGDYREIAEEIIQQRRKKPFENMEELELEKLLFGYSDSVKKCQPYLTTVSRFFTVRITAVSGVAKASTVIALTKDGKKTQTVAVISG